MERIAKHTVVAAHGGAGRLAGELLVLDGVERAVVDESLADARVVFGMFFGAQMSLGEGDANLTRCLGPPGCGVASYGYGAGVVVGGAGPARDAAAKPL